MSDMIKLPSVLVPGEYQARLRIQLTGPTGEILSVSNLDAGRFMTLEPTKVEVSFGVYRVK